MDLAALGIATAYLLLVTAGHVGALLVLLWLFRDTPGSTENIKSDQFKGSRSAERSGSGGTHSAPVEPDRWEDEAA